MSMSACCVFQGFEQEVHRDSGPRYPFCLTETQRTFLVHTWEWPSAQCLFIPSDGPIRFTVSRLMHIRAKKPCLPTQRQKRRCRNPLSLPYFCNGTIIMCFMSLVQIAWLLNMSKRIHASLEEGQPGSSKFSSSLVPADSLSEVSMER